MPSAFGTRSPCPAPAFPNSGHMWRRPAEPGSAFPGEGRKEAPPAPPLPSRPPAIRSRCRRFQIFLPGYRAEASRANWEQLSSGPRKSPGAGARSGPRAPRKTSGEGTEAPAGRGAGSLRIRGRSRLECSELNAGLSGIVGWGWKGF